MNILSFDIEDWFHLLDHGATQTEAEWAQFPSRMEANMDKIFDLLAQNNQKATFFCLGWVAQKYPYIIKKIDALGYEIGTHSHLHQLAYSQNHSEYAADLRQSIDSLEQLTGKKITAYRAPGFSITQANSWAFDVLAQNGITTDCSVFPASRAHGGFPEFNKALPCRIEKNGIVLKEFPINTATAAGFNFIFSGGGYFRLLPYWAIKQLSKEAPYIMSYFHPRDFDPTQPLVPGLSAARRFKSYVGLKQCLPKLQRWLHDYPFTDLQTATKAINWEQTPIVTL
jgi:peptidoglycan-N-acetylglucosamine deacetylase